MSNISIFGTTPKLRLNELLENILRGQLVIKILDTLDIEI